MVGVITYCGSTAIAGCPSDWDGREICRKPTIICDSTCCMTLPFKVACQSPDTRLSVKQYKAETVRKWFRIICCASMTMRETFSGKIILSLWPMPLHSSTKRDCQMEMYSEFLINLMAAASNAHRTWLRHHFKPFSPQSLTLTRLGFKGKFLLFLKEWPQMRQ